MLKCQINTKYKFKKLEMLPDRIIEAVESGLQDALDNLKGYAIKLERGHNANGIVVEMVESNTMEVKARVYANPDNFVTEDGTNYLYFEYFGTGTSAELEHIGRTKHFIDSGYSEWFIPVKKVSRHLNYPIVEFGGQLFYQAYGSKANHFLTDAEFKSRNENKEIIIKKINEMIKEVCS